MNPIKMIKASAGSGKTYCLMQHLSQSIASGTAPEKLLATTYTVKAAAELQSRIREKLLEMGRHDEAQRVFDGLIGTVNSVCGQLLNQYAIEAGLPPQLDVIPEENATQIFEAAISQVIDKKAESLNEIGDRLNRVPIKQGKYQKAWDWKDDVKTIVDLARSNCLNKCQLRQCAEDACMALKDILTASRQFSLKDIAACVKPCAEFDAAGKQTRDTINKIKTFLRSPTWQAAGTLASNGYAKTKDQNFPIAVLEQVQGEVPTSKEFFADLCAMIRGVFACAADALQEYDDYKKAWGLLDFIDQESKVLALLESNPEFAKLLRERLTQIQVDEFQDTSPIQLALFLKLNEISQRGSVWVGDPKQAIYGFRGTDPELMQAAANAIKDSEQLEYSWRSKENLVRLANAIFTKTFSTMPAKEVALEIPPQKAAEAAGGIIEAWHLRATKDAEHVNALAAGIADLIRKENILPSNIAVLMKTNAKCAALALALKAWNLQASAPAGQLMASSECQLIMTAYRYSINPQDTVALASILALSGEFPDWLQRLQQAKQDWLALPEDKRREKDFLESLRSAEILQKLQKSGDETPLEILERVITALGFDTRLQKMPFPDKRMSNLEELRRLCRQYMEQAQLERRAATPAGFAAMLINDDKINEAPGFGRNSVNVLTYHKAKGLEWPVVILESLDSDNDASAFGISVKQAPQFDLQNPLQNRSIHYWPGFFDKGPFEALANVLQSYPLQQTAETRAHAEDKRVFYVGLTRAKERLIVSLRRKKPTKETLKPDSSTPDRLGMAWLERLSNDLQWNFPMEAGKGILQVGSESFDIDTRILEVPETAEMLADPPFFTDALPAAGKVHLPARLAPSQQPKQNGKAEIIARWATPPGINCKADACDLLGNAFHAFIAINPQSGQMELAERLLTNWQQQAAVKAEALVSACQRLYEWIEKTFPGSTVSCEVPITWRNAQGQLLQGFVDMLIESADGYVIVDHKTTYKQDPLAEAASHAAQLLAYRKAVELASGKKILNTIIHLPLMGICANVF